MCSIVLRRQTTTQRETKHSKQKPSHSFFFSLATTEHAAFPLHFFSFEVKGECVYLA